MGKSRKHTPADKWERVGGMAALGAVIAPAPTPATVTTMNTTAMTTDTTMNTTTAPATVTTSPAAAPANTPAPATAAAPAAAPTPAPKADLDGKIVKQWLLDHEVPQRMVQEKTLDFLGIMPGSCSVQVKSGNALILLLVGPAADVLDFYHKGKGDWSFHAPTQTPDGLVSLPVTGLNEPSVIKSTEVKTVLTTVEVTPPKKTGFAGLVETELVGGITVGQVATAGVAVAGAYTIYENRQVIIEGIKAIPGWFGFGKKEEA